MPKHLHLCFCLLCYALMSATWAVADQDAAPRPTSRIRRFPRVAYQAIKNFVLADGITAELAAAEPMLANPVSFFVDGRGRFFVCESHRVKRGVEDNRDHADWVDDDLAAQTVADRRTYLEKHLGERLDTYATYADRLRVLVDRNDNGVADRSRVFADGFRDVLDGTGAGVLEYRGTVFYACIPKLYALRDDDEDDRADRKLILHEGFGVRTSLIGHDLQGLCLGLDGRVYFGVGDRGLNVKTDDGPVVNPDSGAVLRCELDGSQLELFASGLRNPGGLAFDDHGNLFTGDGNSDSSDLARWVHVLEGSDNGWRMAYQYLPDRGPWIRERLWQPHFAGQPAYIVPPMANIGEGPRGIAFYPGTGLPAAYRGNFFLADFGGTPHASGVRTFKLTPAGATFELIEPEIFLWNCLVTDVKFGPDGSLYALDWVNDSEQPNKGRIYRLQHSQTRSDPQVTEVRETLSQGLRDVEEERLAKMIAHPDQRVRLQAQLELASRAALGLLQQIADKSELRVARMHALWGIGQIARGDRSKLTGEAQKVLRPFLRDVDPLVRATAAKTLGECRYLPAADDLVTLLADAAPQPRYAAAIALGKLPGTDALKPLLQMLIDSGATDPALRHAGIMALTNCSPRQLAKLASHEHLQVRLAAVVALRRRRSASVAAFLTDPDETVVREAARAVYDVPLVESYPELAALLSSPWNAADLLRRVLNANHRLGGAEHAQALAEFAADTSRPLIMRSEALALLASWETPSPRDRVLGMWRPVDTPRDAADAVAAVRQVLPRLLTAGSEIRARAAQLAGRWEIAEAAQILIDLLWSDHGDDERAGALLALVHLTPPDLAEIVQRALQDDSPRVRAAARVVWTRLDPSGAVSALADALSGGEMLERQSAVAMLATVKNEAADALLLDTLRALNKGQVAPSLRLDVYAAARRRAATQPAIQAQLDQYLRSRPPADPLAPFRDALHGGNAERGKLIFDQRLSLSCQRCHQVHHRGGRVGPVLSSIGSRRSREHLLSSIVTPNQHIATGFETLLVETTDGKSLRGIVQQQQDQHIDLVTAAGEAVRIARDNIQQTQHGDSLMPADLVKYLTLFDLRDLVAYLSQLK